MIGVAPKFKDTGEIREALIKKIADLLTMPPGDYAQFEPGEDFMSLSKEEKTETVKEVLLGLQSNMKSDLDYDQRLAIDEKRKVIASESMEAGLLTPQEAEALIK